MGCGVSVLFDAAYRRLSETVWEIWITEGTIGFVLMMSGLAFFGSAVRYLVHMDRIVEYTDRKAKRKKRQRSGNSSRSGELRLETDDALTVTRNKRDKVAEAL